MSIPFETRRRPSAELRIAQAQLVGWLEGLFHGIQATLFAQQVAARAQLEQMRQRSLPPGTTTARRRHRPGHLPLIGPPRPQALGSTRGGRRRRPWAGRQR